MVELAWALFASKCVLSHCSISSCGVLFLKNILCFTSYFVCSKAVLPHSPGVVYYHLLLRRGTRIPRVAPYSF